MKSNFEKNSFLHTGRRIINLLSHIGIIRLIRLFYKTLTRQHILLSLVTWACNLSRSNKMIRTTSSSELDVVFSPGELGARLICLATDLTEQPSPGADITVRVEFPRLNRVLAPPCCRGAKRSRPMAEVWGLFDELYQSQTTLHRVVCQLVWTIIFFSRIVMVWFDSYQ